MLFDACIIPSMEQLESYLLEFLGQHLLREDFEMHDFVELRI